MVEGRLVVVWGGSWGIDYKGLRGDFLGRWKWFIFCLWLYGNIFVKIY